MRRTVAPGIELDDDPARIDVDAVHDFLANHSYWAKGRDRKTVERLVREAQRVVGLYDGARQIGFARVVTDDASLAYLADVYVLPKYRAAGSASSSSARRSRAGPTHSGVGCSILVTRTTSIAVSDSASRPNASWSGRRRTNARN